MMRRACVRCGASSMTPSSCTAPLPPDSNAAMTRSAQWCSSSVGVKQRLMISTCEGWMATLAEKPSRRAASVSRRNAVAIVKIREHGVDRRHPGGARREQAEVARQRKRRGIAASVVAIGGGADCGRQVLAAPHQAGEAWMAPGFCRERERGRRRLRADHDDLGLAFRPPASPAADQSLRRATSSGPDGFWAARSRRVPRASRLPRLPRTRRCRAN